MKWSAFVFQLLLKIIKNSVKFVFIKASIWNMNFGWKVFNIIYSKTESLYHWITGGLQRGWVGGWYEKN